MIIVNEDFNDSELKIYSRAGICSLFEYNETMTKNNYKWYN